MKQITIPDASLPFILLQRTNLQRFNPKLYRGLRKLPLNYESWLLGVEARIRSTAVKTAFLANITEEYASLKPHLPTNAAAILDIGCGIAGIDIPLYEHYAGNTHIALLDRTHIDQAAFEYGMGADQRFYNSLDLAKAFLIENGVASDHITLMEAVPGFTLPAEARFDLVISLISWGYHYPVATYLDQVYDALNVNGRVILDIRKGFDGEAMLERKFGRLHVIYEDNKQMRCLAIRE